MSLSRPARFGVITAAPLPKCQVLSLPLPGVGSWGAGGDGVVGPFSASVFVCVGVVVLCWRTAHRCAACGRAGTARTSPPVPSCDRSTRRRLGFLTLGSFATRGEFLNVCRCRVCFMRRSLVAVALTVAVTGRPGLCACAASAWHLRHLLGHLLRVLRRSCDAI